MVRSYGLLAAAVLLVQLLLQSAFFPWSALASHERLNNIDAPFHQYQSHLATELCEERRAVGYDPRFGAGHIGGVTFNASAKVPALLSCAGVADSDASVLYKQVSFWFGVIAPALVVAAAAALRLPLPATALAGVFGLLLWWTGPLRWYHTAGLTSFVFIAYAAPAFAAAFMRHAMWKPPRVGGTMGLACVAALGFLIHPLFAVAVGLLAIGWFALELVASGHKLRSILAVGLILAVMIGTNWAWLYPSLTQPSFVTASNPYQRVVDPWLFVKELAGMAPTAAGGSRLYGSLLAGAVAGLWLLRGPPRRWMLGVVIGAVFTMAWASVGGLWPAIGQTQPNRFSGLAWLALSIPAAAGFWAAWLRISSSRELQRTLLAAGTSVALVPVAYFVRETWREALSPAGTPRYGVQPPEVRDAGPIETAILRFLSEQTDGSARVLLENSLGRVHDGGHVAGLIAWASGRSLIGGPYLFTLDANAWDDHLFGRRASSWPPDALAIALDDYNVGWMLCHSTPCKSAMAALPAVRQVAQMGPVVAFRRDASPGFVAQGSGRVTAECGNRVELVDVYGSRVVLRYRWVPGLRSVPGGRLSPAAMRPGGPIFVAIDNPPTRLALRMGDGDGIPCRERTHRSAAQPRH